MTQLGLVYDSETSGIPDWHKPSGGENQPHIVQLVAMIVNLETREVLDVMNELVKPDGWTIPDDVIEVHGITNEAAEENGHPEEDVVRCFFGMWTKACDESMHTCLRIGHNESFDRRMIRIATKRIPGLSGFEEPWHGLAKKRSFCTAYKSSKAVGIPPTDKMKASGRHFNKTPTLGEAYEHFTGEPLENAHDALVDVEACLKVYWAIQDLKEKDYAS